MPCTTWQIALRYGIAPANYITVLIFLLSVNVQTKITGKKSAYRLIVGVWHSKKIHSNGLTDKGEI